MNIRPSALPFLSACPKWISAGGNTETDAGTRRHEALRWMLSADGQPAPACVEQLTETERDGVTWAADYIRCHAPMSDHPLVVETKQHFIDRNFNRVEGTPDVICGSHLFDLKWRKRDYAAQMAAYALMMWEGTPHMEVITAHVLFAEDKVHDVYTLERDSAEAMVQDVIDRASDSASQPTPCEYCGWCGNREQCPALVDRVNAVIAGREDWALEQYHTSQISTAGEMGKALRIARRVSEWAEAVEHHAKEMAVKQGVVPDGFKLQTRQGNRHIPSVIEAYKRCGLAQEQFLAACEVRFSALVEQRTFIMGGSKAGNERELESALGDAVVRKPGTVSLIAIKEKKG